jgi:hypothetical protein
MTKWGIQRNGVPNLYSWTQIRGIPHIKGGGDLRDIREIDSWMRRIWLKAVKKEYDSSRILEESNLHSTVYFHL